MTTARVVSGTNTSTGTGPRTRGAPARVPRAAARSRAPAEEKFVVLRIVRVPGGWFFLRRRRRRRGASRPLLRANRLRRQHGLTQTRELDQKFLVPAIRPVLVVVLVFVRIVAAGVSAPPGASVGNIAARSASLARSAASSSASVTSARDATLKVIPGGATNSGRHALSAMACLALAAMTSNLGHRVQAREEIDHRLGDVVREFASDGVDGGLLRGDGLRELTVEHDHGRGFDEDETSTRGDADDERAGGRRRRDGEDHPALVGGDGSIGALQRTAELCLGGGALGSRAAELRGGAVLEAALVVDARARILSATSGWVTMDWTTWRRGRARGAARRSP